jgi:hypothetical protein
VDPVLTRIGPLGTCSLETLSGASVGFGKFPWALWAVGGPAKLLLTLSNQKATIFFFKKKM